MLASLGRYETLEFIYRETQGRILDRAVVQMWLRTKEAFADMAQIVMQAPSEVPPERLRELHIRLQLPPEKA